MSVCDVTGTCLVITAMIFDSQSRSVSQSNRSNVLMLSAPILSELLCRVQPTTSNRGSFPAISRYENGLLASCWRKEGKSGKQEVLGKEKSWWLRRGSALQGKDAAFARDSSLTTCYLRASIRSSATRPQWAVSASTLMRLTGVPCSRFSRHQARWGKSIRYIVAHMQTIGDRK